MGRAAPTSLPRAAAAGAVPTAPAAPLAWLTWTNLSIVYVVWGSTYLAIRVMVDTIPPLLGAGARFMLAGSAVLAFLAVRRGVRAVGLTRAQAWSCLLVGTLLMGGNALVTLAETSVPSALAALLIASIPLFVIVLRRAGGDRVSARSLAGVAVGFAGVALLLAPGERPDGATLLGMLGCIAAAALWATGSVLSPRRPLPRDPFVSTGWQMLLGGAVCALAGAARGEVPDVQPGAFSTDSVLAFAYLVTFGSLVAFSAYVWLLQNVRVSKVATYAYVNPVIAIALGWLVLGETISPLTLAGAAVIVGSVATVVRAEAGARTPGGR